ncbi:PE-PPE domain-containing protein [Mycobacterium sp. UM_CSW]|uniref:PE family protein n=1 Tax=Mycobacterium sp. UM_CSW TaxID=1370119 RepID=UPI0004171CD4|nr:PE-PPE domain-containing protein [Mycobacterium sp. UM_CSW]
MTYLVTQPDAMAAAATEVSRIRSVIGEASSAAARPTSSLIAAAGDEVSAATATVFNTYAAQYHAAVAQASSFQGQFVQLLRGSGLAYAETEVANAVSAALNEITSAFPSLLGGGTATPAAGITNLILGASGYPIPWQIPEYVTLLPQIYLDQLWNPGMSGTNVGIATPEGLYPLTGIKDLTFDVSAARGVSILNNAIQSTIASGATQINVFGYSQSANIVSQEMMALNPTNTPGGSNLPPGVTLNFTLVGDVSNPNGGLLTRFPGLSLPSLGLTFGLATPDNSFPTKIFTIEYDGFADFPRYPLDIVSDVNAFFGIIELHGQYPYMDPTTAVQLTNTAGPTLTDYYIYPTANLPLLDPVRAIPVIGHPVADLIQPDLRVIVDLGYGSTTQGWSPDAPNVPTGFGVIPPVSPVTVLQALGTGTQQGLNSFISDIGAEAASAGASFSTLSLPSLASTVGAGVTGGPGALAGVMSVLASPDSVIGALQGTNSYLATAVSGAASDAYATLLPTADIANALTISMPSYDINLFLSGVKQAFDGDPVGGLVYALGAPVAADTALVTLATGFEFRVIEHAATSIVADFTGTTDPLNP